MADQNRDVTLSLLVETLGTEGVQKLQATVAALAKEGGDAAPAFAELAAEIGRIADQSQAVTALADLRTEVGQLAEDQGKAGDKARSLAVEFAKLNGATRDFASAEQGARESLRQAQKDLADKREALARLKLEYTGAGRSTDEYRLAVAGLSRELLDARSSVRAKADAYNEAKAATAGAAAEEAALSKSLKSANAESDRASGSLRARSEAMKALEGSLSAAGIETRDLAAAQTQLLATMNRSRESALALADSVAEMRKQEEAAKAAAAAQAKLNDAWRVTGVRSAAAIQAEIRQVVDALVLLQNNANTTGAQFGQAFTSAQQKIKALEAELAGVAPAATRSAQSIGLLGEGLRQLSAYYGAFELGRSFFTANIELERLKRTLTLVTGSTDAAATQIAFLRQVADKSGVAFGDLAGSYSRFVASAASAGITLGTVNRTFEAVTMAAGSLGLSADETGGALNALGQIASKGVVSMEELRQQLGDRLPAVMQTTAKGLGLTTDRLIKLVEQGQILGDETFFQAFSKGIEDTFGNGGKKVHGFAQELARLKSTWSKVMTDIGETGMFSAMADGLKLAGGAVKDLWVQFETVGKAIGISIGAVVDFSQAVKDGGIAGAKAALDRYEQAMSGLAEEQVKKLGALNKAIDEVADSSTSASEAQSAAAKAAAVTGAAHDKAAGAARGNADAQKAAGEAAKAAGDQAAGAASKWYSIVDAYAQIRDTLTTSTVQLDRLAEAKKIEGDAAARLAELSGDEVRAREAATRSAVGTSQALENVAQAREREAAVLRAQIDAMRAEAAAMGGASDGRKRQIEELERLLGTKSAEAEKSRQAAEAAALEATVRQAAAATYRDNAGALYSLRQAAADAQVELANLQAAQVLGEATHGAVAEAARRAALAEAVYRDALADTARAAERKVETIRQSATLGEADFKLQTARAKTEEQEARAIGDTAAAIDAKVRQKEIEIQITRAKIEATELEADAMIRAAEAARAEAAATGRLTPEKQAEIDGRIANANVKKLEAEAGVETIRQLELEVGAIRERNQEVRDGAEAHREVKSAQAEGSTSSSKSTNRKRAAEGFKAGGIATRLGIAKQLQGFGVPEEEAERIAGEFTDANGKAAYLNNAGQRRYGGSTLSDAVLNAAQEWKFKGGKDSFERRQAREAQAREPRQERAAPSAPVGQARTYTVNVNLPGHASQINVASDGDAQALAGMLKRLEGASRRSI